MKEYCHLNISKYDTGHSTNDLPMKKLNIIYCRALLLPQLNKVWVVVHTLILAATAATIFIHFTASFLDC